MKKFMTLAFLLMLMVAVVACGNDTTDPATDGEATDVPTEGIAAEISVAIEEPWTAYYEAVKERVLAANPDSTIEFITTGAFDHLDTIDATNADNEDVADVFPYPLDRFYNLHQNEVLAAIDAENLAANIGGWDNFAEGFAKSLSADGEYFGMPMNIETLLVFVNKANAEGYGIDINNPVEFTEIDQNALLTAIYNAWYGVSFTNPAGIELLAQTDDGFMSDFTKEWADLEPEKQAVVEAFYNYFDAHKDTQIWDNEAVWGYIDAEAATGGGAAFVIEGPWNADKYVNQIMGEDGDVMPLNNITIDGKPLSHWKGGWAYGVNVRVEGDEDKMALAQAFIAEALNPEFAVDFYKETGKIMENSTPATFEESDLDDLNKKVIANVFEGFDKSVERPLFNEWGQVWTTFENGILSWNTVKPANAEEAYNILKDSFDAMMQQIGGQ